MLATLLIVFREMIEAGLIIGIVLAATRDVPKRGIWISYGVLAGLLGSCVLAFFANSISDALAGIGQEMFNVSILMLAVIMLAWHNVWMARYGRDMAAEMNMFGKEVAVGKRSLIALSLVVGLSVLREGSEVVLFLYSIAISGRDSITMLTGGAVMGCILGICVTILMYTGLLHIPARYIFKVTSWLIALLAAGMAAQAVGLLQQAGMVTFLTDMAWDSSHILSVESLTGKVLHTLIGYNDRPTDIQVITHLATLAIIFILMRIYGKHHHHSRKKTAASSSL